MENLLVLLIIGLLAGWLAGLLYKGSGFGLIGNIVVGLVGSVLGGYLAGVFGINADNLVGTILVATGGAVVLLVILNFFSKGSVKSD
ncbi:MAG: GlsB/YeaQ/YmgE family stress response membrane protein [Candidatus Dojkabacteria bacterium]|jgi:uncharacterized membrane protein YeaQ/YmgE (transglycosylase-associated protein family)